MSWKEGAGMRGNGISYDTGFVRNGGSSREPFDPEVVRRELRIIRDDLHCNAVRIMGGNPERLELAPPTPPNWAWRSGSHPIRWS
jgi:hypothetical protein